MELARHLSRISPSRSIETEQNQEPGYTAARAREIIADAVRAPFGDLAPAVVVDDSIVANAIAGPRRIRLNANAPFSRRYIDQLIQHEALVHVATFLNGRAQTCLPLLARGHPGITQTQEGLAVFAELMSGTKDSLRFRRLADRAIAIDMAIQGADFIQVWRYFQNEGDPPAVAFDHTQRVFRGGVLSGGAGYRPIELSFFLYQLYQRCSHGCSTQPSYRASAVCGLLIIARLATASPLAWQLAT